MAATANGEGVPLLTARTMADVEAQAMASGAVSGGWLMARAGEAVVAAIGDRWPAFARAPARALILCGPGNNGGDGFVIASRLQERGWTVTCVQADPSAEMPPDAAAAREDWQNRSDIKSFSDLEGTHWTVDLIVDALFGTGLTRALGGPFAELPAKIADARSAGTRVVAVDAPSGLCLDSGRVIGAQAVVADLTVQFAWAKAGAILGHGPDHCGWLDLRSIGLERWTHALPDDLAKLVARPDSPDKRAGAHKYGHGALLVLGGPPGAGGAARLAARAGLRIGAGLVTLAVPKAALPENAARLDAVMLAAMPDAAGLAGLAETRKATALCLGPGLGLGLGSGSRARVLAALETGLPSVLDADALTVFADAPDQLFEAVHEKTVLTPHGGEFKRLFPDLAAQLADPVTTGPAFSRIDAARAAAERAGATILLKGPDTVIAAPDGSVAVHAACYDAAAPWLATAGAGDVLAGLIAGLLARGWDGPRAAATAAWIHADAARRLGPGLIAEDLPDMVPAVLRGLNDTPSGR
ncbi:NAD(P)H-hydrate dehydratase [Rhodobacteraceae bacterium KN286]|uniref:Bifunctional NAD(P)H-hydrate repair enzyme n=2 Tax=Oceanomicrobium pacificus TaxID=2692916 RepID=A0A6B0U4D4_9RHOB|nr:NAD(P)H-hydrate dehydratase [Oceanomicrobium pacificus]